MCEGKQIITVAGLGDVQNPHPLQTAFRDLGAAQCGFCIPGQLMSATALLQSNPDPTVEEIQEGLAGNLCRCAGYEQLTKAVLAAARGVER